MGGSSIAFCGLDCGSCLAFIARKYNDQSVREKVAKEWTEKGFEVSPQEVNCDGCTVGRGVVIDFCRQCKVRSYAIERDVESCTDCEDFICDNLDSLYGMIGLEPKEKLQQIHLSKE